MELNFLVKNADPSTEVFASTVNSMANQQLKADAWKDIGTMGVASLGAGAAGAGLVGLINVIRRNREKKNKSGPALLPLPYPIEKMSGLFPSFAGDDASTKGGIPWYGPAMMGVGLGGIAAGWKGVDSLIDMQRTAESQAALDSARSDFHDALLSQYDRPLKSLHKRKNEKKLAIASDNTMQKVGADLDKLWGSFEHILTNYQVKQAMDLPNMSGMAMGGYGVYGGLSGLVTGALVYNQMKKRSRQAILDKAIKQRDRLRSAQSPTEIYAVPEPIETGS